MNAPGVVPPVPGRQAPSPRGTARLLWWVLFVGALAFAAVATAVGPGLRTAGGGQDLGPLLGWLACGMAAVELVVSRILPGRVKPAARNLGRHAGHPEALGLTRTLVAAAINEGAALFAGVAWMVGGAPQALLALAIAVLGLLLAYPSDARWRRLCGLSEVPGKVNPLVR